MLQMKTQKPQKSQKYSSDSQILRLHRIPGMHIREYGLTLTIDLDCRDSMSTV